MPVCQVPIRAEDRGLHCQGLTKLWLAWRLWGTVEDRFESEGRDLVIRFRPPALARRVRVERRLVVRVFVGRYQFESLADGQRKGTKLATIHRDLQGYLFPRAAGRLGHLECRSRRALDSQQQTPVNG